MKFFKYKKMKKSYLAGLAGAVFLLSGSTILLAKTDIGTHSLVAIANLATTFSDKRVCTGPDGDKGFISNDGRIAYLDNGNIIFSCLKKDPTGAVSIKIVDIEEASSTMVSLLPATASQVYATYQQVLTSYPFKCVSNAAGVDAKLKACDSF